MSIEAKLRELHGPDDSCGFVCGYMDTLRAAARLGMLEAADVAEAGGCDCAIAACPHDEHGNHAGSIIRARAAQLGEP